MSEHIVPHGEISRGVDPHNGVSQRWTQVGAGSVIHQTVIIHPGVVIGECSTIEPFCELGSQDGTPLKIGKGAIIRSHTTIYGGSQYGDGLETGHHVLLRSDNAVGENLRIGSYSSLEGGAWIGDYVRIHGRCEMTRGILHDFARVYGGTYITDNRRPPSYENELCILDAGSVVMMGCILVAGVRIGVGSVVGAGIVVTEDVPDGHILTHKGVKKIRPDNFWPPRYRDDYPEAAQPRLDELHARMLAL